MVKNVAFHKILTNTDLSAIFEDNTCGESANTDEDNHTIQNDQKKQNEDANKLQYINFGEEDQMEIYGYKYNNLKMALTWVFYFLTVGLLRLFFHWYPQYRLYATHSACSLATADKVLIMDDYKGKYKSYFVKHVKTLSSNFSSKTTKTKDSVGDVTNTMGDRPGRLSINFMGGKKKDLLEARAFWCKKLCYIWDDESQKFVKLVGLDKAITNAELHEHTGFSSIEQLTRRITYGNNEIDVPLQTILTLLVLEALTPFYIFQVFSLIVWCSENYYYYTIAIIVMSTFGITSSIIQTRKNQKNLKGTVHSTDKVSVCRGNDVYEDVPTTHLVPGDVISIPPHGCIMHCDAVLLNGNCIVNESMLTGESVPVTKTPLPNTNHYYNVKENANHTLFCGTKVIQTRYYGEGKVLAVVIRTGYLTSKGQLVRSIMYPPPADFKFDQDSYKFIGILAVIALCGFIYTVVSKSTRDIEPIDILIKALDLITIVIPPALPAAMTVGKLYALNRLKKGNIYCINSRIINVSGSINCVCFDKTGTLTEDGLDMWGVLLVEDDIIKEPLKEAATLPVDSLFLQGMVSCHSLTLIEGQLSGDPLDVKMFEATDWILEEPEIADNVKYDLLVPTIVKPPATKLETNLENVDGEQAPLEIGIVHQYQFSSTLQRMSVVTKTLGADNFRLYCKGSPEMIVSLSKPETVPLDIFERLKEYTKKGYRVIALGTRSLDMSYLKIQRLKREDAECELTFLGFIIMENRLKPQTNGIIEILKNADIKLIMITGDNIQTAISVARECGIVDLRKCLVDISVDSSIKSTIPVLKYSISEESHEFSNGNHYDNNHADIEKGTKFDHCFTVTGQTWGVIRQHYPTEIPKIVTKGVVFARMSSEQKQQLILELQSLGYYVAMCGDGANDCGALKAAHVGISLSEAESSVASPFTSKEPNISCVPLVIKEGRAALVTSFGVFKFMICYSLTEFTSAIILYGIDANLNSLQYLFIDICLILNFASFFGITKAWDKSIVKVPPMTSLLSVVPLLSIIFNILLVISFQVAAYHLIQIYDWFEPFVYNSNDYMNFTSYENYSVFTVSLFQYIIMAIVFSKGKPYRKAVYTNIYFSLSVLISIAICCYITLDPSHWIIDTLELKMPPIYNARLVIVALAAFNFIMAIIAEDFILEYVVQKKIKPKFQKFKKTRRKYLDIEKNYNFSNGTVLEINNERNGDVTRIKEVPLEGASDVIHLQNVSTKL